MPSDGFSYRKPGRAGKRRSKNMIFTFRNCRATWDLSANPSGKRPYYAPVKQELAPAGGAKDQDTSFSGKRSLVRSISNEVKIPQRLGIPLRLEIQNFLRRKVLNDPAARLPEATHHPDDDLLVFSPGYFHESRLPHALGQILVGIGFVRSTAQSP